MSEFISPVIGNRFPGFIKEEYTSFDKFLRDYLDWLETDENFIQILNAWSHNLEPSNNVDEYLDAILRDTGFVLDREISIPKSTLLHFLKDFYLSRGSAQSFKFIFRLLFNADVRIEYPREQLLWLSSANYGQRHFIFIQSTHKGSREYTNIISKISELGGTIQGSVSKLTAFVEDIKPIQYNGGEYLQIEIQRPLGEFLATESVSLSVGGFSIVEQILPIADIQIVDPGVGYLPGDRISITGTLVQGSILVDSTSTGGVTSIQILNAGCNYNTDTLIYARQTGAGAGFTGRVTGVTLNDTANITNTEILSPGSGFAVVPEIYAKRPGESMILDSNYGAIGLYQPEDQISSTPGVVSDGDETTPSYDGDQILGPVVPRALPQTGICVAKLKAHSTEIGKIIDVTMKTPYLGFDPLNPSSLTVSVESQSGSGAILEVKPISRFAISSWEDSKGFLAERCFLLDSDKYQQFSYEVISSADPTRYQDIVADLLHPVGYSRFAIVEIEDEKNRGPIVVWQEIQDPSVLLFPIQAEEPDVTVFSLTQAAELPPSGQILVPHNSNNHILVDENEDDIIWA